MKSIIVSVGVLLFLLAIVITNTIFINLVVGGLEKSLEQVETLIGFEQTYDEYLKNERWLSLTVDDMRMQNIENAFVVCVEYSRQGLSEEAAIEKSRLLSELRQMRRLCGFNIKSIM